MSEIRGSPIEPEIAPSRRVTEFRRVMNVMFSRGVVVFGTVIIGVLILTAIFAPLIAPYDAYEQDLYNVLETPSKAHLLGTDELGRDLLSRIIFGSQISLAVGFVAIGIAAVVGMGLGLAAGHFGGLTDTIIMRVIDAMMALPPMILILAVSAVLGGGFKNVLIALGIGMTPTYCRLMRGQILTLKENDYITAAVITGASEWRIMLRHLVPNAFPPLMILITLNLGTAIMIEASLSFLGIGITPPTPTWGGMVSTGYRYLLDHPLLSLAPGIAIILIVLGFNLMGDGLRDALDPRLRGII
jgi:peptide/nickel transport system permease protein